MKKEFLTQIKAHNDLVEKGETKHDNVFIKAIEEKISLVDVILQRFKEINLHKNLTLIRNHYTNNRDAFIADYHSVCKDIQQESSAQEVSPPPRKKPKKRKPRKKQPSSTVTAEAALTDSSSSYDTVSDGYNDGDTNSSFDNYGHQSFFAMPDFDAALDGIGDINELLSTAEMGALIENTW